MESDVLRELYEKYHQKAYLYVLSFCRDKETAEDIVSEGFEKAFLTVEGCPEGVFLVALKGVQESLAGYPAETETAGGRNACGNPCARGCPFRCAAKRGKPAALYGYESPFSGRPGTLDLALFRGTVHQADGRAQGNFRNGCENGTVPRQSQTETEIRR